MKRFSGNLLSNPRIRFALILIIALLVRLIGIASRPIWYDEAFSILFAEKGPNQMLFGTLAHGASGSAEEHPLAYYILLWKWIGIFGNSLISARALSITAGLLIVYLTYKISIQFFDIKTSETAMLISAFSPFQVHYAQEIRMYSFLALWLLLATFAYLRASSTRDWRWWTVFAVSSALAQYTHGLAAFYLIPLVLLTLINRDWKSLRALILSGCVALSLYSPWLIQLPSQFAKVGLSYWLSKPDLASLFTLLIVYTANTPIPDTWLMPALLMAIFILIIGLIQTIKTTRGMNKLPGMQVFYLSFAMPIFLFLFSQWKPIYLERALLPSSAIFCIWLAWIFNKTNLPNIGRGLLLFLLVASFLIGNYQHITYQGFPYGQFKEIGIYLEKHMKPGDKIIHSNKLTLLPEIYFQPDLPQTFIGDLPNSATDTLAPTTQQVLRVKEETNITSATRVANRVWYIIYKRSIDEFIQAGEDTHPDIKYLQSVYSLDSLESWGSLQVYLFSKHP